MEESRPLHKGDIIVVPAGTPHWFKQVPTFVNYLVVKALAVACRAPGSQCPDAPPRRAFAQTQAAPHARGRSYLSLSATLANAAVAQATSLSPPGAPLTATAPISWSPTLIGIPPMALMVPGRSGGGTGAPAGRFGGGPEGRPNAMTLLAFICATSIVPIAGSVVAHESLEDIRVVDDAHGHLEAVGPALEHRFLRDGLRDVDGEHFLSGQSLREDAAREHRDQTRAERCPAGSCHVCLLPCECDKSTCGRARLRCEGDPPKFLGWTKRSIQNSKISLNARVSGGAKSGGFAGTTDDVMPTFRSAEASRRGGPHDDERCYWPLGSSAIDFTVSVWPSTVPVTITFHDLSLSVALMNASACSLPFGSNFSTLWSAVIRL